MWERTLSQKLVRLFCEQKVIDEAKTDAYVYGYELLICNCQISRRMDTHGIIVVERFATFHYY